MSKNEQIEEVLGECFDPELLPKLEKSWKAYYCEPTKYAGTVVVDLVNK